MYQVIKSCVSFNGTAKFLPLPAWDTTSGKLISYLFALYLNDLEDFIKACSCSCISLKFVSEENLYFYLKLIVLLYADGSVIFGTYVTSFQKNLDTFYDWILTMTRLKL